MNGIIFVFVTLAAALVAAVSGGHLGGYGDGLGGYGGGYGAGLGHVGYGGGNYKLGYGFVASGYGGHGGYGGGHGGYGSVGKVQVQQTPHQYSFAVNEHGPHSTRYHHQSAYIQPYGYGHGGY